MTSTDQQIFLFRKIPFVFDEREVSEFIKIQNHRVLIVIADRAAFHYRSFIRYVRYIAK